MNRGWKIIEILHIRSKNNFNAMQIRSIFSFHDQTIILGKEDGVVEFYKLQTTKSQGYTSVKKDLKETLPILTLESKGGPIQTLLIHDVTRLYNNDLIVADSKGTVTFFCNEQILCRKTLSDTCITCMKAHTDPLGNVCVLIGDSNGHVTAFTPYAELWRLRLTDAKHNKSANRSSSVRCLLPLQLAGARGRVSTYVLAADDTKCLYFIQGGVIVKTVMTPHLINSMCSGHFVGADDLEMGDNGGKGSLCDVQVALASETGAIYIMSNFEVYNDEYVNIQVPIKQIETLKAADTQDTDTLLCTGQFNGLSVIRNSKELLRHNTGSWVVSMVIADIDKDGVEEVVLGCHDNIIYGLKMKCS